MSRYELSIEELHLSGANTSRLPLSSIFGPATDRDELQRLLAAATRGAQSPARSRRIVSYTIRRRRPVTHGLELQPCAAPRRTSRGISGGHLWGTGALDHRQIRAASQIRSASR